MNDASLREQILAIFAADERVAHAGLRVGVLNGIAHLAGSVESLDVRSTAEDLAGSAIGVRGIANRIDAPGAPSPSRIIQLDFTLEETGRD